MSKTSTYVDVPTKKKNEGVAIPNRLQIAELEASFGEKKVQTILSLNFDK